MKLKKKGRPPLDDPMVHTAVLLPSDLLVRLKKDARGHGLSAEIRKRLQTSYHQEGHDPRTGELVACIEDLAKSLARDLGVQWYSTEFAREAFKAGVAIFLAENAPGGSSETSYDGHPDDAPPVIVGRTHARLIWIARHGSNEKKSKL